MVEAKTGATPPSAHGTIHLTPVVARTFRAAVSRQDIVPVIIDSTPTRAKTGMGASDLWGKKRSKQKTNQVYLLLQATTDTNPNSPLVRVVRIAIAATRSRGAAWVLQQLAEANVAIGHGTAPDAAAPETDWRAREAENWKRLQAEFFQEHTSVTAPELADLTNSQAANRSARAHDWAKAGKVFSVSDGTVERYPVFQLRDGSPHPVIAQVLKALGGKLTPWQTAMWLTTPNAEFADWRTPLDRLDAEPEAVVAAALREVEEVVF